MSLAVALNDYSTIVGTLSNDRSAPVTIGPWSLTGDEIPEAPVLSGSQGIIVHKLLGGDKRIDILGDDPNQLRLTGKLFGPNCKARSDAMEAARVAGKKVKLSLYGTTQQVLIVSYSAEFGQNLAWCEYTLVFELPPAAKNSSLKSISSLSKLLGSDVASAVSSVTDGASEATGFLSGTVSQLQSVAGQVAPIANIVGAGGILSAVTDKLSGAQNILDVTSEIGNAPAALSSFAGNVGSTFSLLESAVSLTGQNMAAITSGNATSLATSVANTAAHANAVAASGYVSRAAGLASMPQVATPAGPQTLGNIFGSI